MATAAEKLYSVKKPKETKPEGDAERRSTGRAETEARPRRERGEPKGRGDEAMHVRHAHERMQLHAKHRAAHHDMHVRHEHEHRTEKGDKGDLHARHEREHREMNTVHEREMARMHQRHEDEMGGGIEPDGGTGLPSGTAAVETPES